MARKKCIWLAVDEPEVNDVFETGCGEMFQITHGSPHENNMKFCCYCGGKLHELYLTEEEDDE